MAETTISSHEDFFFAIRFFFLHFLLIIYQFISEELFSKIFFINWKILGVTGDFLRKISRHFFTNEHRLFPKA